jgi:hypothetical protein
MLLDSRFSKSYPFSRNIHAAVHTASWSEGYVDTATATFISVAFLVER